MVDTITRKALLSQLGITPQRLTAWLKKGLPTVDESGESRFATDAVEKWLLSQGLIEEKDDGLTQNATSRQECARHFGVHEYTISMWMRQPGFPGRPSEPGKRNGYYPLQEIEAWRQSKGHGDKGRESTNGHSAESVQTQRAKLLAIQCKERELKLAAKKGELIAVAEVTAFITRAVNAAGALIDELPDVLLACLPADIGADVTRSARQALVAKCRDIRTLIGELGEGDEDEDGAANESVG